MSFTRNCNEEHVPTPLSNNYHQGVRIMESTGKPKSILYALGIVYPIYYSALAFSFVSFIGKTTEVTWFTFIGTRYNVISMELDARKVFYVPAH